MPFGPPWRAGQQQGEDQGGEEQYAMDRVEAIARNHKDERTIAPAPWQGFIQQPLDQAEASPNRADSGNGKIDRKGPV